MGGFFDGIIAGAIQHRHVVLLCSLGMMVLGIWTAAHASTDALPDFTPPRVVVQTEAPGMDTLDVEQLVTGPLERVLLGTPQMINVRSTTSPGLSVVTLMFEDGVDIYRARQLVTERIQLGSGQLPPTVSAPRLAAISAPVGALLKFCITSAVDDTEAPRALRTFADWRLRPRLLGLQGVAQVSVLGGSVERVEVRPDSVRMRQRGVTLEELSNALRGSQAMVGAGFVEVGEARLDVHTEARLTLAGSAAMLQGLSVKVVDGVPVLLGEVAEVLRAEEPRVGAVLYDGRPAVFLQVNKLPWADTRQVTLAVEAALRELQADLPQGARMEPPVFRQASFVETSLHSVGRAMVLGAFLVVAVLLVFLRSGRLAAISLTAIPLSILAAAAVLVGMGVSINGMTLGGLAIAVGEVVDDAIIDVENVWRRLCENARGASPRPALAVIRDASREIRGSVVYATLIVCLVLTPVLLLGGVAGRIFAPLAQAYILAIAASLLVALTVTPAMCAWLLPRISTAEARPTRLSLALVERYRRLLRGVVERPCVMLVATGVLVLLAAGVVPFLGGRFLPEFNEGTLIATVTAVPGTSLEESLRLASRVDAQLRPEVVDHVAARVGRGELDEDAAPVNTAESDLVLKPGDDRELEDIAADLASRIGRVPGLNFTVEGFLGERVHEILAGDTAPVVVKVVGPELDTLRALASQVSAVMEATPGLSRVRVEPQVDVPQVRIRPDPAALARHGVLPLELAEEVATWRQGREWTRILEEDGRSVEVALAGPPAARTREALRDLPVTTRTGGTVALSVLVAIEEVPTPAVLRHEDGERRIHVGAGAAGGSLSSAVETLEQRIAREVKLPRGYRLVVGGEAVARSEAATRLLLTGGLVLLGILMLLSTAFGSLQDAGIVLLNFPLGLVGGVLASALTPEGLSVASFVGFITLFGIIARNGIMLVAHKRQLDEEHPEVPGVERVLRAAEERLLPILMTAATAGLGLLPLALSFGAAGSELEAPMALIVCGGLLTSTALNMLVLPTVYVWLEKRSARRVRPAPAEEAS